MSTLAAREVIETLGMARHPEGGWYVQTFEDDAQVEGRARSTAIYYLLEAGDASHWHRVDAVEVWHWYSGAALQLQTATDTHATLAEAVPAVTEPSKAGLSCASASRLVLGRIQPSSLTVPSGV